MKTIVLKESNISLYLFDDSMYVLIDSQKTTIGDPVIYYVDDCNTENAILFEGVTQPEEWEVSKYFYTTEGGWVLNPDWTPIVEM